MFIYQPLVNSSDRVVWYGGESTQLQYEHQCTDGHWWNMGVRILGNGLPSGMSDLHAELVDYYNYCQTGDY